MRSARFEKLTAGGAWVCAAVSRSVSDRFLSSANLHLEGILKMKAWMFVIGAAAFLSAAGLGLGLRELQSCTGTVLFSRDASEHTTVWSAGYLSRFSL